MSILHDIRRKNCLALIKRFDTHTEFASKVGLTRTQLSQMVGASHSVNIGHIIARRIEQRCDMPRFWLDTDHDVPEATESNAVGVQEMMIESVILLHRVLKRNKIKPESINEEIYRNLLRHVIAIGLPSGRITESQVQSALTLSGAAKAAG